MVSMVCDLPVWGVTPVLLIGLTPTDRRLTLQRSGRTRLGTPATLQNQHFPKCLEELWEQRLSYCGRAGTPESKTKLLSVKRSWKRQFGRKTEWWKYLHGAGRRRDWSGSEGQVSLPRCVVLPEVPDLILYYQYLWQKCKTKRWKSY